MKSVAVSKYLVVGGMACALAFAGLGVLGATAPVITTAQADAAQAAITEDDAKAIALENAWLAEKDVTFTKVHLDTEDGALVYEVEFFAGPVEYDYDIDAVTGEIISYDLDAHIVASKGTTPSSTASVGTVDEKKAKAIALEHAGLTEKDVTFTKVQQGTENKVKVFEIEFISGDIEYEYDIEIATGKIIKYDLDFDPNRAARVEAAAADGYIGEEIALATAFGHAGVAPESAMFVEIELDVDDMPIDYDISFTADGVEYDYEIDAVTGDVLTFESEVDD